MSANASIEQLNGDRQVSHLEEVRKMSEILETSKTDVATTPNTEIPGAWYDLYYRIRSAKAASASVFVVMDDGFADREERVHGLICAVCDVLELAIADLDRLEKQIEGGT